MNTTLDLPSKSAIARSFSRAAEHYDRSAELQRRIGHRLLNLLPRLDNASAIADLGCGTGYFTHHLQEQCAPRHLIGLDIAEGMLGTARRQNDHRHSWIAADAERLPLADRQLTLLFSNLALQWCHDFDAVLNEAHRTLDHGGLFVFTSLCHGTLWELQQSWQHVDEHVHVNRFAPYTDYRQWLHDSPFTVEHLECCPETSHYPTLKALMGDLKGIGAHNINPDRNRALTGRRQLQALTEAYERLRTEQGLPTTYQVLYAVLRKE